MSNKRVFLHAQGSDFAETEILCESAYLERCVQPDKLSLLDCGCDKARLVRIQRSVWMRLLPMLRLYRCQCCGVRVLRPRVSKEQAAGYGAVYLPARPIRVAATPYRSSGWMLTAVYQRSVEQRNLRGGR